MYVISIVSSYDRERAMRAFTRLTGPAVYLSTKNIDTDVILPARYLKALTRDGLGGAAFYTYRFDPRGNALKDSPFNRRDASIAPVIIAGENFGCGSSREHAAWALYDFGVRAILSTGFADIFASNAFKNGLLLIELPQRSIDLITAAGLESITIDLAAQTISSPGIEIVAFEIDAFRKQCLLNGLDEISLTEKQEPHIAAFEREREYEFPWIDPIRSRVP
jgi:3-isopropylmalate/(R)-2-methylmalate dehydratase small subunit